MNPFQRDLISNTGLLHTGGFVGRSVFSSKSVYCDRWTTEDPGGNVDRTNFSG